MYRPRSASSPSRPRVARHAQVARAPSSHQVERRVAFVGVEIRNLPGEERGQGIERGRISCPTWSKQGEVLIGRE
eukprot:7703891-Alexandrium_andersonii.AAC.1